MRRLALLVYLLVVLPFQMVWAVAAPVCGHETELGSKKHFGHHEHKHQSDQSSYGGDSGTESKSGIFDSDCGVCHASCSMAVCDGIAPLDFAGADLVFARPPTLHLTLFSSKPERPKWLGLA